MTTRATLLQSVVVVVVVTAVVLARSPLFVQVLLKDFFE